MYVCVLCVCVVCGVCVSVCLCMYVYGHSQLVCADLPEHVLGKVLEQRVNVIQSREIVEK